MPNDIRIVIADDNEDFTDILQEYLSSQDGFLVSGIARDGLEAVEIIKNLEPDVVILDIIMPNLDGLGVLEKVNLLDIPRKPLFIILSALSQDKITSLSINLGATFYIVKPFDLELLAARIRQLGSGAFPAFAAQVSRPVNIENLSYKPEESTAAKVTGILDEVGVPSHLKGFQYLLEAICMVAEDITLISSVMKRLYPAVADKFDTVPMNVERSMRNALDAALERGSSEKMSALLGYDLTKENIKVVNSEFIARVADRVRF